MAKYSGHWYSHEVLKSGTDAGEFLPSQVVDQESIYCWADFGKIRGARFRTLILLSTLLREKYVPDLGEDSKLPQEVVDKAIRECLLRMAEVALPDEICRDDQVEEIMKLAAKLVDKIDPADDIWIDNLLDSVADQVYGIGHEL